MKFLLVVLCWIFLDFEECQILDFRCIKPLMLLSQCCICVRPLIISFLGLQRKISNLVLEESIFPYTIFIRESGPSFLSSFCGD